LFFLIDNSGTGYVQTFPFSGMLMLISSPCCKRLIRGFHLNNSSFAMMFIRSWSSTVFCLSASFGYFDVDPVQVFFVEEIAELFQFFAECEPAGVFSDHNPVAGQPNRFRRHNFIRERIFQHTVLMNSRFVSKCIFAHNGLVWLTRLSGNPGQQLAGRIDLLCVDGPVVYAMLFFRVSIAITTLRVMHCLPVRRFRSRCTRPAVLRSERPSANWQRPGRDRCGSVR
jgi:hypothetical protein